MHPSFRYRLATVAILCFLVVPVADAAPVHGIVGDILDKFFAHTFSDTILNTAKSLFWSLATTSLVWTMGMMIVRQDIGEMLMELLRFIVVTGIFYWLLINASVYQGGQGFVDAIVRSFLQLPNDDPSDSLMRQNANDVFSRGQVIFFEVINEDGEAPMPDQIIAGGLATIILSVCAVMSAQFLLALIMAWILGYAGIFLLGFGGARWTSPIAVNFYKHVVAVGAALLVLGIIGTVGAVYLRDLKIDQNGMRADSSQFDYLGLMLGVSILMVVLSIKVPQMLYTLITGSTLGLYAGTASAAGIAIANAGSSAYAAATGRHPGGPNGGDGGGFSGGVASHQASSVMDAVQRSAAAAGGIADPFHVGSGTDPFGVARAPDTHRGGRAGSLFGGVQIGTTPVASGMEVASTEVPSASAGSVTGSRPEEDSKATGKQSGYPEGATSPGVDGASQDRAKPLDAISSDGGRTFDMAGVREGAGSNARAENPHVDKNVVDHAQLETLDKTSHRTRPIARSSSAVSDSLASASISVSVSHDNAFDGSYVDQVSDVASRSTVEGQRKAVPIADSAVEPTLDVQILNGGKSGTLDEARHRTGHMAESLGTDRADTHRVHESVAGMAQVGPVDVTRRHIRSDTTPPDGVNLSISDVNANGSVDIASSIHMWAEESSYDTPRAPSEGQRKASPVADKIGMPGAGAQVMDSGQVGMAGAVDRNASIASAASLAANGAEDRDASLASASTDAPSHRSRKGLTDAESPPPVGAVEPRDPPVESSLGRHSPAVEESPRNMIVARAVEGPRSHTVDLDREPASEGKYHRITPDILSPDIGNLSTVGDSATESIDMPSSSGMRIEQMSSDPAPTPSVGHRKVIPAADNVAISDSRAQARDSGQAGTAGAPDGNASIASTDSVTGSGTLIREAPNASGSTDASSRHADERRTGAEAPASTDTGETLRSTATVIQEDMKPTTSAEGHVETIPGAIVRSPTVLIDEGEASPEQTGDPDKSSKPRKRRLRRRDDDPAQSSVPQAMDTPPERFESAPDDTSRREESP